MLKDFWKYINKPTTPLWKKALVSVGLIWGILVILVIGLEIPWALLGFPIWQAVELVHDRQGTDLSEVARTVQPPMLEGLKTVLPSLSGVGLSAAAIVALLNFRVTQDKQVTDLFVKAVEMLGHDKLEVRVGGIYSLERIARNSDREHWTVMEVLAAFVQKDSSGAAFLKIFVSKKPGSNENEADKSELAQADIQAALTAIGRRDANKDPRDGRRLSLINANLNLVHVEYESDFRDAILTGANLIKTYFPKADFTGALLIRANLLGAFLTEADFTDATLQQADLRTANIEGAILTNADLEGANFREVSGREAPQIVAAKNWWLAKYDDEFAKELTEFAQKQAEHDLRLVEQLRLFEQSRQAQSG